jgi:hypothetical protein
VKGHHPEVLDGVFFERRQKPVKLENIRLAGLHI